jgi:hypothetical protein
VAFFINGNLPPNNENRRRIMFRYEGFPPFFKDKDTANAVLTVLFRYNRGIDPAESFAYAAAKTKHKAKVSDIKKYWAAVKNQDRWINQ